MCNAISVATFGRRFISKCVAPIPHLQRAERMLDCLTALSHGLRVLIETFLHRLQHVLVLPACDAPLRAGRAAMLDRAVTARIRPVAPQLLPFLLVRVVVLELLAGRTAIDILFAEVDEVLFAETALRLNARCHRFWKRHGDIGLDFLTAEVVAVRNGFELVDPKNSLRLDATLASCARSEPLFVTSCVTIR